MDILNEMAHYIDCMDQNSAEFIELVKLFERKMTAKEHGWNNPSNKAAQEALLIMVPIVLAVQAAWPNLHAVFIKADKSNEGFSTW